MKSIRFTLTFFLLIISFNSNALYKLKDSYLGGVYESPAAFVAKYQGKCTYVNYRQGHWSKTFEANEYRAYVLEPTYSDASCTKVYDSGGYASRYKNWVSTTFNCPDGQELNPATNACETPQQQCEEIPLGSRSWTYSIYGDSPSICMNGCSVGLKGMAVCTTSGNSCSGDLAQDGSTCSSGDGMKPGGDMPEVPPGECQWQGESGNQTLVCKGDSDGDGKPDDGAPPDEDGSCEWDGNTLTCTGGTFDPSNPDNPSNPNNPDNGGDTGPVVVNPPTGGGDGVDLPVENTADILTAIKNFNSDNNKNAKDINGNLSDIEKILMLDADSNKDLLHEINTDNNKGFENVVGAIKNIEGYDPTTTDGILNEIKANNIAGFDGVISAIGDSQGNDNTDIVNAIEGLHHIKVNGSSGDPPIRLYMPEDLRKLNDEIKELEKEYKDSVDAFKNFFSPDSNYQGGKFNSHNIALNWQGTRIEKDNVGFMALRDNAYIFSSIVMLLSGFLGIRAIVGGF